MIHVISAQNAFYLVRDETCLLSAASAWGRSQGASHVKLRTCIDPRQESEFIHTRTINPWLKWSSVLAGNGCSIERDARHGFPVSHPPKTSW